MRKILSKKVENVELDMRIRQESKRKCNKISSDDGKCLLYRDGLNL